MSEKKDVKEKIQKAGLTLVKAGQEIINFSEVNEIDVKILTCKPDKRNVNGKLKDSYEMTVEDLKDNKKVKNFSVIQKRLMELISELDNKEGIINQSLRMTAYGIGTKRRYEIQKL